MVRRAGSTVTGGYITLKFNDKVEDNPNNPYGLDFIVFSNPFFLISGGSGDPHERWQKPGFVEISQDGITWYLIKPNILPLDLEQDKPGHRHFFHDAQKLRRIHAYHRSARGTGG